ncbi:hypothetical protein D4740_09375 [Actinomyces sp. 2119]|nr:hypothetical protein D4740_09375 [Actinomyces sp. 2119]
MGRTLTAASAMWVAGSHLNALQPGHLFWASRRNVSASIICCWDVTVMTMWSTPMVVLAVCCWLC